MPLIGKNEPSAPRPVIIVIYGTPGVGKTSLFNTSKNPILLDCDRGFDRACNRADLTISARDWQEVLMYEPEIKKHSTLGIDTAKAALDDYLQEYVCSQNWKLRQNKLAMYGALGEEFKSFTLRRQLEALDIVILAHTAEDKEGDITRLSPDVTGQSKQLLIRKADQVGYISVVNGKRTLTFEPTDKIMGKNVARIPTLIIPDEHDPKYQTFMAEIIERVRTSISSMSEEQCAAIEKMEGFKDDILRAETAENLNAIISELGSSNLAKGQKEALKIAITDRSKALGLIFDKDTKTYTSCSTQE